MKWAARFAGGKGRVLAVTEKGLSYVLDGDEKKRRRYLRIPERGRPFLQAGDSFDTNQVIAGQVAPLTRDQLRCRGGCDIASISRMLASRERTVRFTGCKLARLAKAKQLVAKVRELANDREEDIYVRLEAKAYLCLVAKDSAYQQFRELLIDDVDDQIRLEAALTLAETPTPESFELLCSVLKDPKKPLFLRCACAWAVGCHKTEKAAQALIEAFDDACPRVREEALLALQNLGSNGLKPVVRALEEAQGARAAGAAETLRRLRDISEHQRKTLARQVASLAKRTDRRSTWATWALAHLPKMATQPHVARLENTRPEVHYAIRVLWAFLESWIANDWTPRAIA